MYAVYCIGTVFLKYKGLIQWDKVSGVFDKEKAGQRVQIDSNKSVVVKAPSEINQYKYSFIIVFSDKHFESIKRELHYYYGIPLNIICTWHVFIRSAYLDKYTRAFYNIFITEKNINKIVEIGDGSFGEWLAVQFGTSGDSINYLYHGNSELPPLIQKYTVDYGTEVLKRNEMEQFDLAILTRGYNQYIDKTNLYSRVKARHILCFEPYSLCEYPREKPYLLPEGIIEDYSQQERQFDAVIYTVTHKDFYIDDDDLYYTLCVGGYKREGCKSESDGNNIAYLNPYINECTALYWMWKNTTSKYYGLCHYRRFFLNDGLDILENRLDKTRLMTIFNSGVDMVVAKPEYLLCSLYENILSAIDKDVCDRVYSKISSAMNKEYPDYINLWERVLKNNYMFARNMFVGKREVMNEYCTWLFTILFEAINNLDLSEITGKNQRVIGYFAETMFTCWILKQEIRIYELPIMEVL